ncbi:MAG TPA: LPS export ABC transporter periplasmic protein LptC [Candidatus Acidoferrales bacterium]|jgi:lipopolysaccharide export system protein LptA|nr:LPS export ABC transporter periplasmic protein LptC [Candidatus Acidoferrales bacterium]
MRNSEARKYARWSLAVAGLLAAIVVSVYGRNTWMARQAEKKAPPPVPSTVEERSNEFSYSKVEGQRTIYTVKASRTTSFKEGSRNLLEDVAIVVYGKAGDRNDTLRTNACDFISNTGQISCAGDVQINLQAAGASQAANAVHVATSGLTFDRSSGVARTDKPVTFRWPGGDGHALGVTYDSNNGILRLVRSVDLNLSNSPAEVSVKNKPGNENDVHVSGDSMLFQRDTRVVQMLGSVHAQQAAIELVTEKLQLDLDSELQAKRFVASGNPRMHDVTSDGPIALIADEIASDMRADGSVKSIVATGNVHATQNTPVGGDGIDAGRIQLDLATQDNVPHLLTASNGVTLTSTSAAFNSGTRHIVTDALEMHFAPPTHDGSTHMESANSLAPARVDWRNVAIVNGKSVPQVTRMAGKQINLKFNAQNQLQQLVSTGGVEVNRKLGDDPEQTTASRELIAKFDKTGEWTTIDQSGDVHFHDAAYAGQSDRAHVDRASNTVTLDGSVLVADASMQTTAQSATFSSGANLLHADGHVMTTDLHPSSSSISNLAQEPAHISGEHLVADTTRGHATYTGKARMWQGESVVEADTIELDRPTQILQAKGHVRGVFPQAAWNPKLHDPTGTASASLDGKNNSKTPMPVASRMPAQKARTGPQLGHVRGGLLTYWETESRGRIEQDARVDSEQGSIQADRIDLYFSDSGAPSGTKQLSRSVANGGVTVSQQDRRGTSERAEYTASEGKFVLSEGKPTLYSSTGDTTTGRQLTFFFADDRILVDSADGSRTVTLHQVEK